MSDKKELKGYQKFFNKRFGYRKDYQASFWYYINQYIKRVFEITHYTDAVTKPTTKRVEIKGPRGGRTGNYKTVDVPLSKATYRDLTVSLLRWTWFGVGVKFHYSKQIYFQCSINLMIYKLDSTFKLGYSNI